jgi:hypothetical protein
MLAAVVTLLTLIWLVYGHRLWRQGLKEGHFTII